MSKLPEKINQDMFGVINMADTINSIIDYLAELKLQFNLYIKDPLRQQEKSCETCLWENVKSGHGHCSGNDKILKCVDYSNWLSKFLDTCPYCDAGRNNKGLIYHRDGCPDKPEEHKQPEQPEYKRLWDEAKREYNEAHWWTYMTAIRGKYLPEPSVLEIKIKYELALKAAEKRIKELEESLRRYAEGDL